MSVRVYGPAPSPPPPPPKNFYRMEARAELRDKLQVPAYIQAMKNTMRIGLTQQEIEQVKESVEAYINQCYPLRSEDERSKED